MKAQILMVGDRCRYVQSKSSHAIQGYRRFVQMRSRKPKLQPLMQADM
jgi:hypothetical protein